jgi:signal transduction histidine kinase
VEVEFRVTWPNHSRHWILLLAGRGPAAPDDVGRMPIVGLALDITVRKESELEHLATADAEKKARQESEEATRAMDHFVTTVSHELRSPLGAIMSWATLLQRANDASHTARAGTVIERNARQLTHMVDDLLDSGAIATGKLSIEPVPVDLAALAGNVAEDMRMNFEEKGLALVTDELESCMVLADENRLRQVIWNLLTNAAKFCAHGSVTVAVRTVAGAAEVRVSDTGCGIAPEALGRVFERFHQEGRSARASGLGLGLWLVRNIVTLHGGSIHAESDGRDRGATFRVSLPLYRR